MTLESLSLGSLATRNLIETNLHFVSWQTLTRNFVTLMRNFFMQMRNSVTLTSNFVMFDAQKRNTHLQHIEEQYAVYSRITAEHYYISVCSFNQ